MPRLTADLSIVSDAVLPSGVVPRPAGHHPNPTSEHARLTNTPAGRARSATRRAWRSAPSTGRRSALGFGHHAAVSDSIEPTRDDWLAALDATTRSRAESLRNTFARLGADDPEGWARSEIQENIAQLGRFVFLRGVWREIERWRDSDAVARLFEEASDEAIELARQVVARAALDVALGIVQLLDNEGDIDTAGFCRVGFWWSVSSTANRPVALLDAPPECSPDRPSQHRG